MSAGPISRRGKQNLVQVCEPHVVTGDGPGPVRPHGIERREFLLRRGLDGECRGVALGPSSLHDARDRHRILAHDRGRIALRLDALERRGAQQAVSRPLRELRADHHSRLHPPGVRQPWRVFERRGRPPRRLERREQLATRSLVEAAADLAGVVQGPLGVDRDDQRADIVHAPLSRQPTHHHQLLIQAKLDLQPVGRSPAGLVAAIAALGDDPLQVALRRGMHERLPVAHHVRRRADDRVRAQHVGKQSLPVLERHVDERATVEVEQVECHVGHRDRPSLLAGPSRGAFAAAAGDLHAREPRAFLQQAEVRTALLVQCDHLAIDHRLVRVDPGGIAYQLRQVRRRIDLPARPQPQSIAVHDRLHAIAIPLDFE